MPIFKFEDYVVKYQATNEIKDAVFNAVLKYFKDHQAFSGEVIMQNDDCVIDAPEVMSSIADDIIKFEVVDD